jgi:integrase
MALKSPFFGTRLLPSSVLISLAVNVFGLSHVALQAVLHASWLATCFAGEAVKLTWDRVDLDRRTIFVDKGKTKAATRKVPLTSRVVAVLTGLKAKRREGVAFVFTRYKGKQPLTVGWASHEFGRIAKLLELPKGAVMHSLRHSFASRLGNKGCATADLMTLCGWESPSIAKRYTPLKDARMAEVVGFLEPETENV